MANQPAFTKNLILQISISTSRFSLKTKSVGWFVPLPFFLFYSAVWHSPEPQLSYQVTGQWGGEEVRQLQRDSSDEGEDQRPKQVQSETSIVGEDSKPAKASFQEGMTKLLTDVKESIKQPDPESDSVENQVVGADTQKNTKKGEGIESNQQQTKSDIDDEGTKASPVIEGVAKIFSDIKEENKN